MSSSGSVTLPRLLEAFAPAAFALELLFHSTEPASLLSQRRARLSQALEGTAGREHRTDQNTIAEVHSAGVGCVRS